jgi:hypothetical protein
MEIEFLKKSNFRTNEVWDDMDTSNMVNHESFLVVELISIIVSAKTM